MGFRQIMCGRILVHKTSVFNTVLLQQHVRASKMSTDEPMLSQECRYSCETEDYCAHIFICSSLC